MKILYQVIIFHQLYTLLIRQGNIVNNMTNSGPTAETPSDIRLLKILFTKYINY